MKRVILFITLAILLALTLALSADSSMAQPPAPARAAAAPSSAGAWRSGGPYDAAMQPLPILSVAASPDYNNDATLFAAGSFGLYRTTNRGQHWQWLFPDPSAELGYDCWRVQVSPAYAADGTIFFICRDRSGASALMTLFQSTDRGQTWTSRLTRGALSGLAISPAYASDHTLFTASQDVLLKSTDSGVTWTSYSLAPPEDAFLALNLVVSPAYTSDHTLYATGYPYTLHSTDGGVTWNRLTTYGPPYGLAISPAYASDGTVWHTYRATEGPGDDTPESAVLRTTNRGAHLGFRHHWPPRRLRTLPLPPRRLPRLPDRPHPLHRAQRAIRRLALA